MSKLYWNGNSVLQKYISVLIPSHRDAHRASKSDLASPIMNEFYSGSMSVSGGVNQSFLLFNLAEDSSTKANVCFKWLPKRSNETACNSQKI